MSNQCAQQREASSRRHCCSAPTLHPPSTHLPAPIGSELIASLYAYRSIARALPSASGSEANKKAIYTASFEVRWTACLPYPNPEAPTLTPLTLTPLTRHTTQPHLT